MSYSSDSNFRFLRKAEVPTSRFPRKWKGADFRVDLNSEGYLSSNCSVFVGERTLPHAEDKDLVHAAHDSEHDDHVD